MRIGLTEIIEETEFRLFRLLTEGARGKTKACQTVCRRSLGQPSRNFSTRFAQSCAVAITACVPRRHTWAGSAASFFSTANAIPRNMAGLKSRHSSITSLTSAPWQLPRKTKRSTPCFSSTKPCSNGSSGRSRGCSGCASAEIAGGAFQGRSAGALAEMEGQYRLMEISSMEAVCACLSVSGCGSKTWILNICKSDCAMPRAAKIE